MHIRIYIHAPELPNSRRSRLYLEKRLANSKIKADILINETDPKKFEYPTLSRVWEDSKRDDFYAIYMHLKGSSKESDSDFENALCWMDYMLYGIVDNWNICKNHLDAGADLVGSQWHWHFKGNFWWARSCYLRTLPDPLLLSNDRFAAEYWCCWGFWKSGCPKPAIKNLFYVDGIINDNLYASARRTYYPPRLERKTIFVDSEIDGRHGETIDRFLIRRFYCAFDEIFIPTSKIHLLVRLADFLNYDGSIFIGENMYDAVRKSWGELSRN